MIAHIPLEPKTPTPTVLHLSLKGATAADMRGRWVPNPQAGEPMEADQLWTDGTLTAALRSGRPTVVQDVEHADPKFVK